MTRHASAPGNETSYVSVDLYFAPPDNNLDNNPSRQEATHRGRVQHKTADFQFKVALVRQATAGSEPVGIDF